MQKGIRNTVIVCVVIVAAVLLLTWYSFTAEPQLTQEELRELGAVVYDEPVELNDFQLVDQQGREFSRENLEGQWTLIFFGYTSCPDICPLTLNELTQFYNALEAEQDPQAAATQVALVTVDPERDTPERMGDYVSSFHEDFVGLTGEYDQIADLARQLYVAHSPPPSGAGAGSQAGAGQAAGGASGSGSGGGAHAEHEMAGGYEVEHSGNILIVNPDGRYHGFFSLAVQDDELLAAYPSIRALY